MKALLAEIATLPETVSEETLADYFRQVAASTPSVADKEMVSYIPVSYTHLDVYKRQVLKRKWKQIFSPYHLVDAVLIAIFLIPMSIGLYQQFDMHPEKTVNGLQNVSGLRFFFWSQSFGRITGESPWNNNCLLYTSRCV